MRGRGRLSLGFSLCGKEWSLCERVGWALVSDFEEFPPLIARRPRTTGNITPTFFLSLYLFCISLSKLRVELPHLDLLHFLASISVGKRESQDQKLLPTPSTYLSLYAYLPPHI